MKKDLPTVDTQNDEYIVISRTLFSSLIVGIVMFAVGGVLGYYLALVAYNRGMDNSVAALQASISRDGSADIQPAPQPTQASTRINNVSVDDDPYIGPNDAPITIVEFSDFR